jgi:F-type H+-transporting ATPase subunit b
MCVRGLRGALFAFLVVLPLTARASGGEGESPMTLFWQAVNLAILIAVLVHFARKPVQDFFRGRRDQVRTDLDSAAGVLADAEHRLADWQARADRLEAEIAQIKETARRRAETERQHILADAEASASRIRGDATAAVEQELARARAELRAEAATLATRLAGDLLRRNLGEADQRKLVEEFVARVESSGAGGRA